MSKKNKDIQVVIEEDKKNINGTIRDILNLSIGKKIIGQIMMNDEKKFVILNNGNKELVMKTQEEAIEYIIRQWNLND